MNKKNLYWGLIFILIAVYLVVSSVGILPKLPVMKMVFTALFAAWALKGAFTLSSFEFFIPVGILGNMYDKEIGIEAIVPFPWWIAVIFLAIGFEMIFGNVRKSKKSKFKSFSSYKRVDNSADGSYVNVRNIFSETNKYVNSNNFTEADIDNKFGQTNVYFNNAIMPAGVNGSINIENAFGETDIYIPRTWRVEVIRNCSFGEINEHGHGNNDIDAHYIVIKADCTFGEINIYFE